MSHMKNSVDYLGMLHTEMVADQAKQEREELERLRWEVDRAVSNLDEALMRAEKRRNDESGRLADEAIAAGKDPF